MTSLLHLGSTQLLPIKEASEFVPYTRDYVARLAREGKIVATQIDRQWFVDVTSLQNFFTHSTIEESVRKRHLSNSRKRDLEVREVYRARLEAIAKKRNTTRLHTALTTALVMLCGLSAGAVFVSAGEAPTPKFATSVMRQMPGLFPQDSGEAAVIHSATVRDPFAADAHTVTETEAAFDVSNGIVLLPSASSSSSTVEDLFSDPVTVDMTSTTTGSIRNTVSNKSVPFVRVPTRSVVVPNADEGNTATQ